MSVLQVINMCIFLHVCMFLYRHIYTVPNARKQVIWYLLMVLVLSFLYYLISSGNVEGAHPLSLGWSLRWEIL